MEELDFIAPKRIVGKMISVDVLDKIRAEINQMPSELTSDGRRMIRRAWVLQIIDKHKAESERV